MAKIVHERNCFLSRYKDRLLNGDGNMIIEVVFIISARASGCMSRKNRRHHQSLDFEIGNDVFISPKKHHLVPHCDEAMDSARIGIIV